MLETTVAVCLLAAVVSMAAAVVFLWREAHLHGGQTQVLVGGKTLWVNMTSEEVEATLRAAEHKASSSSAVSTGLGQAQA
jgi:hypothetical protein